MSRRDWFLIWFMLAVGIAAMLSGCETDAYPWSHKTPKESK
jgi:hypothetical protein